MQKASVRCPCSQEDYECDYCYAPASYDSTVCEKVCDVTYPPFPCVGTYTVSRGFRLIDGDQCDPFGGLNLLGQTLECPGTDQASSSSPHNHGPSGGIVALVIILTFVVVFVVIGVCLIVARRDASFRGKLTSGISSVSKRLPAKLRDPFARGVGFVKLDMYDDEDLNESLVANDAKELDDDAILSFTSKNNADDESSRNLKANL